MRFDVLRKRDILLYEAFIWKWAFIRSLTVTAIKNKMNEVALTVTQPL